MTLPRLTAITERWSRIPPLSVSVANIAIGLGVQKSSNRTASKAPAQAANDEEMGNLIAAVGGVTEGLPDWLKAGFNG